MVRSGAARYGTVRYGMKEMANARRGVGGVVGDRSGTEAQVAVAVAVARKCLSAVVGMAAVWTVCTAVVACGPAPR